MERDKPVHIRTYKVSAKIQYTLKRISHADKFDVKLEQWKQPNKHHYYVEFKRYFCSFCFKNKRLMKKNHTDTRIKEDKNNNELSDTTAY